MKTRSSSRAARRRIAIQVANLIKPAETRYVRDLRGVAKAIAREYVRTLGPLLGDVARADGARFDVRTLSNEIDVLGVHVQIAIPKTVGPLFDRMSRHVVKANARGQALMGISPRDTDMPGMLARARDENIKLVERAHRVYAASVRDVVSDPDNFGLRVEDLKEKLLERGDVSESRAELIARDQTLKLNGQIAATRQQAAGVERYTWSTSGDDRVRDTHAEKEGQVFSWSDPPADTGHPGQDYQCRCIAIPMVDELDDLFG